MQKDEDKNMKRGILRDLYAQLKYIVKGSGKARNETAEETTS